MAYPTATWPVLPDVVPPAPVPPAVPVLGRARTLTGAGADVFARFAALGTCVARPFLRDGRGDFATRTGADLVRAAVGQVLGTHASSEFTRGEVPWRPEFGSLLYLLRHQPNTPILDELVLTYVTDALSTWEPRVRVTNVSVTRDDDAAGGNNSIVIRVKFNFVDLTSGTVLFEGLAVKTTV